MLYNGLGRYDAAVDAARPAFERDQLGYGPSSCPSWPRRRQGPVTEPATAALGWLSERARVTPTDWAVGVEARVRALVERRRSGRAGLPRVDRAAGRTRVRTELARTHLLYGEWLRRRRRREDARAELRTAHQMFEAMGMEAFAERARRELIADGETVHRRNFETSRRLTPQEEQIARLACDGRTNPEIGVRLFLSARTVEWHLRKVFARLGISSRRELPAALALLERTAGGRPRPRPSPAVGEDPLRSVPANFSPASRASSSAELRGR